jgi:NAD(P)-dependent dehydrogenase (short-subunit alcohol dehydrogenase family)
MKDKVVIISGGTSGVGLSIVKHLAANNYNVFFIGSNEEKGKQIEIELRKTSQQEIHFVCLDLSKLKAVNEFVTNFITKYERLDMLMNIAGVVNLSRIETSEGIEKTFATGYLSAFVLSTGLIPLLEKTKHSRILNVAGDPSLILKAKLNLEDLSFAKNYNGFKTAIATVHAKTVFTAILSEKLSGKNIIVNSFHPGIVKSNLTRNLPFLARVLTKIVSPFMSHVSKTGIYVSTSDTIQGITGQLFVNKKAIPLHFDKQYKDKLWEESERIVAEAVFGVIKSVGN